MEGLQYIIIDELISLFYRDWCLILIGRYSTIEIAIKKNNDKVEA